MTTPLRKAASDVRTLELLKQARTVARLEVKCSKLRAQLTTAELELRTARKFMRDLVADTAAPIEFHPGASSDVPQ